MNIKKLTGWIILIAIPTAYLVGSYIFLGTPGFYYLVATLLGCIALGLLATMAIVWVTDDD